MPDGSDIADMVVDDLRARGLDVFAVSAASGHGLRELTFAMAEIVQAARAAKPEVEAPRIVIRPRSVDGADEFTVTETGDGWRVRGTKPERWVRQTDFSNDEAVGFLADRLNRLGVETRLVRMGAVEGDLVLIGHPDDAVVFDFKPGLDAGAENLARRGEDHRLTEERPAARRRRDIQARRWPSAARPRPGPTSPAGCDQPQERTGPTSYEIGSAQDPDADPVDADADR